MKTEIEGTVSQGNSVTRGLTADMLRFLVTVYDRERMEGVSESRPLADLGSGDSCELAPRRSPALRDRCCSAEIHMST